MTGVKAVMFDMDGVIYRGTTPLPGASDAVKLARDRGMKVGFITNNSTRTPETFVERLGGYGIDAALDEIHTSALATAEYIKSEYGEGGTAFVIGMDGCRAALKGIGIEVFEVGQNGKCDYVVVGMTPDFHYKMLLRAQQEILVNAAKFIGTNGDRTFPWNDGTVRPGGGTMVAAVEACTYTTPVVIGKPAQYMIEQMSHRMDFQPSECICIGDRLDTDIIFGNRFGAKTVLVLTGISTREDGESAEGDKKPDFIIDDLNGFAVILDSI